MNVRPSVAQDELFGSQGQTDSQEISLINSQRNSLLNSVLEFSQGGLQRGEALFFIALPENIDLILKNLTSVGVEVNHLLQSQQIVVRDCTQFLAEYVQNENHRFEIFSSEILRPTEVLVKRFSHVRLYGELLFTLFENSRVNEAVQLDRLFSSLQNDPHVSLLCAYEELQAGAQRKSPQISKPADQNETGDYIELIRQLHQKVMGLQRDVAKQKSIESALRESELQLQMAKENAEQANYTKSRFLANMSHEIRSPLTGILGFTELLKENGLSERDRSSYFDIIARNGRQLTALINNVLDLSKAETQKLEVEKVPVSLMAMAAEVVKSLHAEAENKNLTLRVIAAPLHFPAMIYSDPIRIQQILQNIVGNAVKFSKDGEIRISFESTVRPSDGAITVGVRVDDQGIGIPKEAQRVLFRPFSQVDESATREYGGTGLGLVLAKKLANVLGGDVHLIQSEKNVGSSFLATFNSHIHDISQINNHYTLYESEQLQRQLSERKLSGSKILYAEDSLDNQILIKKYLMSAGASVDIADNGAIALEMALKNEYDLILMDVMMPVCDGYTATRRLRRAGYVRPIVALTAHALPEERLRSVEEGCSEHLTKPIQREHLVSVVSKYVHSEKHLHFPL